MKEVNKNGKAEKEKGNEGRRIAETSGVEAEDNGQLEEIYQESP
jgi:hypothetical protein